MIILDNVHKRYKKNSGYSWVLKNVNLKINHGDKIAVVGSNGCGKSTLTRIISGAEMPTIGTVKRHMTVSWPLAFSGAFQGGLTGIDNIKFICRLYNVDFRKSLAFIKEFSDLGDSLNDVVKYYSSGMRARLAFALSMAVDFDCYIIDEVTAVGDDSFHNKCHEFLYGERGNKAMIIISHDRSYLLDHCEKSLLVRNGSVVMYDDVRNCLEDYDKNK